MSRCSSELVRPQPGIPRPGLRPRVRQLRLQPVDVLMLASARRHGITVDDILHAFNHPRRYADLGDGLQMIVGPTRSAELIEVGFIDTDRGPVMVHAMPARPKYLR
jgi:hypothetical protein